MPLWPFGGKFPRIHPTAYVAPGAQLIGDVQLGEGASVWFNCVLRGDGDTIAIGAGTNIQDASVLHVDPGAPVAVGENCVVGHRVILHGCQVHDRCLIGMGATILNRAEIGAESLVAAGALIPEGKTYPPRSLIMGVPGKVVRTLTDEDVEKFILDGARHYRERAALYMAESSALRTHG